MAYEPQSDAAKALGALAGEMLGQAPSLIRGFAQGQVDRLLYDIDQDPEGARESLRPHVRAVVQSLGMTAEELGFVVPSTVAVGD